MEDEKESTVEWDKKEDEKEKRKKEYNYHRTSTPTKPAYAQEELDLLYLSLYICMLQA